MMERTILIVCGFSLNEGAYEYGNHWMFTLRPRPVPAARAAAGVPMRQVDASWPPPLPKKRAIGQVSGIALSAQDITPFAG
jgi:hypothetical protein